MPSSGLIAQWQKSDFVGVGRIERISGGQRERVVVGGVKASAVSRLIQARIGRVFKGETSQSSVSFVEFTDVDVAGLTYREDSLAGGLREGDFSLLFLKQRAGTAGYRAVADYRGGYLTLRCPDPVSLEEALLSPECQGDPAAADYLERFDERTAALFMLGRFGALYEFAAKAYRSENKPMRSAVLFWLSRLGVCREAARAAAPEIRRLWAARWPDPAAFSHLDSKVVSRAEAQSRAYATLQTQDETARRHPGVQAFIRCHPDAEVRAWLGPGGMGSKEALAACVPCE